MDLTAYNHIKLNTRRHNLGHKRSEFDEEIDFTYMVELREAGATWFEITELINSNREYFTTEKQNRDLYDKKVLIAVVKHSSDESGETERRRLIEDLDWIYNEALRKWQELKNIQFQDEISGVVIEGTNDGDYGLEDAFEVKTPSKKYSKKKVGLVEQHQAKYLDTALKALDLKAKISGVISLEKKELTVLDLLKNKLLDDGGKANNPLLSSEEEVLKLYGGSFGFGDEGIELNLEEAIIVNEIEKSNESETR